MSKSGFFQKYPWVLHTLIAIGISLLIVVIVFIILKHYGRVGQEYPTPYVVGQYVDELGNDGLELEYVIIDSIYQPNHKGGYILRQDPDSGAMIKTGRKIYLTVTSYVPDNAIVPDLRSLSVRHAISQLENVGLHGGKLIFVDDPHHVVLEQKYKGRTVNEGRRLEKGAMVDLVVGRGTGSGLSITPYLVGMSPTKARRSILSASLNVGAEHYDGITDMSRAIVYKQSPEYSGRSDAGYGTRVDLWYCDKSVVAMEELERMRQRQMEDSIRALYETGDDGNSYNLIGLDEF
ncbi:MAG: PASTA domain-containing protein [Bacteroidales bacterium]|jgi:beta-lactam-binding protein with PASTA domain|nr:PASTA domain-containing protein [Bacteroidales bacterium]MBR4715092.1 PASTA domain-containing protein [Bacteroidales bacterium]